MRIGLKLTAAFVAIASLVAAAGYIAQITGRELKQQMERLSNSAIRQMAETTEVTVRLYADQLTAHRQIILRRRAGTGGSSSAEARGRPDPRANRSETAEKEIASRGAVESRTADGGVAELTELVRSQAGPLSEQLRQEFARHQELMNQFRVLLDEDIDAAERFLEDQIHGHFQDNLLPLLATIRARAERESTGGIRSAERALAVADQVRGVLLVAAAAVAVSIGLFMSRSIGKPLEALQRAAQDIGRGRLDTRVAIRSRDEIGTLAASLNQMAAELRDKTVSIREKELLLKEVHHRVKNNLQVISSLLSFQAQEIPEPEINRLFQESQARVRSMALIHEQLYRSSDLAHIDFAAYVQELVANLKQGFGSSAADVNFCLDIQPIPLLLDVAMPCGMIVSELVSNALEHAFPEDRPGEIRIRFHRKDDVYRLTVADNGVGMRDGPAAGEESSVGLKVVQALTRQIHGKLDQAYQEGTVFTIHFDNPEQQPPTAEKT
jgi:two-component sensor histidine kinase